MSWEKIIVGTIHAVFIGAVVAVTVHVIQKQIILRYKFEVELEAVRKNLHEIQLVEVKNNKNIELSPETLDRILYYLENNKNIELSPEALDRLLYYVEKNWVSPEDLSESYLEPFNISIGNNITFYINIFFLFLIIIFFFISFFSKNFKNLILDIICKNYFFIVPIPFIFILFKNLKNFYLLNLYIYITNCLRGGVLNK